MRRILSLVMANVSRRELVDRLLDGQLLAMLTQWRADGVSYPEAAFRLRVDHDVAVSAATVSRWMQEFEDERTEATA